MQGFTCLAAAPRLLAGSSLLIAHTAHHLHNITEQHQDLGGVCPAAALQKKFLFSWLHSQHFAILYQEKVYAHVQHSFSAHPTVDFPNNLLPAQNIQESVLCKLSHA